MKNYTIYEAPVVYTLATIMRSLSDFRIRRYAASLGTSGGAWMAGTNIYLPDHTDYTMAQMLHQLINLKAHTNERTKLRSGADAKVGNRGKAKS